MKLPNYLDRLRGGGRKRNVPGEEAEEDDNPAAEEETGGFTRASDDVIRQRRIFKSRRNRDQSQPRSHAPSSAKPNLGRFFKMNDIFPEYQPTADTTADAEPDAPRQPSPPPPPAAAPFLAPPTQPTTHAPAPPRPPPDAAPWPPAPRPAADGGAPGGLDWSVGGLGGVAGARELHESIAGPVAALEEGYQAWAQAYALQARLARDALRRLRDAADRLPAPPPGVEAALRGLAGPEGLRAAEAAGRETAADARRRAEEEVREERAALDYLEKHYAPEDLAWPGPARPGPGPAHPPGPRAGGAGAVW